MTEMRENIANLKSIDTDQQNMLLPESVEVSTFIPTE